MLMAKNGVDGVYTDDPKTNPNAKKLDKIKYDDIIINGLKVMDTSACALCKQNNIPIVVFDFESKDGIKDILNGKDLGTFIN
jgi:uridylate kinase